MCSRKWERNFDVYTLNIYERPMLDGSGWRNNKTSDFPRFSPAAPSRLEKTEIVRDAVCVMIRSETAGANILSCLRDFPQKLRTGLLELRRANHLGTAEVSQTPMRKREMLTSGCSTPSILDHNTKQVVSTFQHLPSLLH